jgi:hypothetical protein
VVDTLSWTRRLVYSQRPSWNDWEVRHVDTDISSSFIFMLDKGRVFAICDTESPPAYPIISHMNFSAKTVSRRLVTLNWATADETYVPRKFFFHPLIMRLNFSSHCFRR